MQKQPPILYGIEFRNGRYLLDTEEIRDKTNIQKMLMPWFTKEELAFINMFEFKLKT